MITLLRLEWAKLYRRFTPHLVYALAGLLVLLVLLMLREHGAPQAHAGRHNFELVGDPRNGLLACQTAVSTIAVLLWYLAPVVCGEILGLEGATGTLRTVLTRPRTRSAVWLAKFLTAAGYVVSLCAFVGLLSLAGGAALFGWGPLNSMHALTGGKLIVLAPGEALRYLAYAYALLALTVFVGGSLAFALGSWFDNALAPGFTALGILVTLQIMGELPLRWMEKVKPYLFTNHLLAYQKVFPTAFDPETGALHFPGEVVWPAVRLLAVYVVVFAVLGWWRFARKDVTC